MHSQNEEVEPRIEFRKLPSIASATGPVISYYILGNIPSREPKHRNSKLNIKVMTKHRKAASRGRASPG
jgi:hypothetical protein